MKRLARLVSIAALGACFILGNTALWAADAPKKNWTPPAQKIYAQKLSDETMARHPELLSVTLHGVPPGQENVYTMFAGSFPERIGNPDDPDDIDVTKKGITILDPRWHRTNDTDKKFVVLMPMRDKSGENVGLVVYAFKNPKNPSASATEKEYLAKSTVLRDELAKKIPSYKALFDPAK
ncbi:MAG: hypothetical protein E6H67_09705 [Betaproteobacteria bacterium]|nr:MAG: hypothetical protein E6H74_04635 [Betaproteobacteria bacterium]TMH04969.1 MAG: hypothetical protein E6H67_09705 [Betaproteobacteria bacterium]